MQRGKKPSKILCLFLTDTQKTYVVNFLVKEKLKQSSNTEEQRKVLQTEEQRKVLQNVSFSSDSLVYLINCKRCVKEDPTLPC